jgi:hypothetical protein
MVYFWGNRMKLTMKRALIITLALWTGTANFAYASARIECADMMQKGTAQTSSQEVKASHACCHSVPCQCAIEEHSNDQTTPFQTTIHIGSDIAISPASVSQAALPTASWTKNPSQSPPQHPPLYALFSVYRI